MLYNTGSWLAADFIPEEPGQNAVLYHWILVSRRRYGKKNKQKKQTNKQTNESAWCYITLDLDQQAISYQQNMISMIL